MFDLILVPTWLYFGSKNQSKTHLKINPKGFKKIIDFCIDVWTILGQFGTPSWEHVGVMLATFLEKMTPGRTADQIRGGAVSKGKQLKRKTKDLRNISATALCATA